MYLFLHPALAQTRDCFRHYKYTVFLQCLYTGLCGVFLQKGTCVIVAVSFIRVYAKADSVMSPVQHGQPSTRSTQTTKYPFHTDNQVPIPHPFHTDNQVPIPHGQPSTHSTPIPHGQPSTHSTRTTKYPFSTDNQVPIRDTVKALPCPLQAMTSYGRR